MILVQARDARTQNVVTVQAEERPESPPGPTWDDTIFAVFEDDDFLGVVTPSAVARHPQWIFADLVPRSAVPALDPDTPIERVWARLNEERLEALPVLDRDGRFEGVVTQRSALQALTSQHRLLASALDEVLAEGLIYCAGADKARKVHAVFGGLNDLLGGLTGRSLAAFMVREDRPRVLRKLAAALRRGRPFEATYQIEIHGRKLQVLDRCVGVREPEGGSVAVVGLIQALSPTPRRGTAAPAPAESPSAQHARLRELLDVARTQVERLDAMVQGAAEVLLLADETGRVLQVNRRVEDLFGYSPAEVVGQPVSKLLPDLDLPGSGREGTASPRNTPSDGDAARKSLARRKDGGRFPVEASLSRRQGRTAGATVYALRDVSRRVKTATRMEDLRQGLERARRLEPLARLAAGMAHDFRNLLTVIQGHGELLANKLADRPGLMTHVQALLQASETATQLSGQVLSLVRADDGNGAGPPVDQALEGLIPILRRLLGEEVKIHESLGAGSAETPALESELIQIVLNLAVNAGDAMPGGGILEIRTATTVVDETPARRRKGLAPGSYVRIEVRDSGHGMDDATLARVFQPFFSTKVGRGGTGIGLDTVYRIVKQRGGGIWVSSEPDKGTVFEVLLPVVDHAPGAPPEVDDVAGAASGTILVVDDERAVCALLEETLAARGYRVLTATNGGEALAVVEHFEGSLDLLLTDFSLPGLDGPALFAALRQKHPEAQPLYMSGHDPHRILEEQGSTLREEDLLHKPFGAAELLRRVRSKLENRQG